MMKSRVDVDMCNNYGSSINMQDINQSCASNNI